MQGLARNLGCGLVFLVVAVVGHGLDLSAAEWPQWRGPDGQGHAQATNLPEKFGDAENCVWKVAVPGRGWSSPVIDGDSIWMTTAIEAPITEEEKKKRLEGNSNNQPLNVAGKVSLRAVCVDRTSGAIRQNVELIAEDAPQPIHQLNSFASPSPVLVDGKLVAHFGTSGTACLDTKTGIVLWTNRDLKINHENGPGSTPIVWKDVVIIHLDGSDTQSIVGLDLGTGQVKWKTPRSGALNADPQLKKAYGTPLVTEWNGQPAVLSPAADWLYAYNPATGAELWKLSYGVLGFSIVPRPVLGDGMLYLSTSFIRPEMLAIRLGATPEIAWRVKKQAPSMPSPLLVGGELYLFADIGVASCLDAKTGEVRWAERLGGNFCSSPLLADGKIFVGNREGVVSVIAPGTQYRLLAANPLDGAVMASPAAVGSSLYIRTEKSLYRIEAGKQTAAK
jgi:outer membrane protein assembly factor BamB